MSKIIVLTSLISVSFVIVLLFLLPIQHGSWIISPAEEYHGWQLMSIDGSISFWYLGYGLNHRYTYFKSTNDTTFPGEDLGWHFDREDILFVNEDIIGLENQH
jgi:hypothetical protein